MHGGRHICSAMVAVLYDFGAVLDVLGCADIVVASSYWWPGGIPHAACNWPRCSPPSSPAFCSISPAASLRQEGLLRGVVCLLTEATIFHGNDSAQAPKQEARTCARLCLCVRTKL
jgi:hypothetical protein